MIKEHLRKLVHPDSTDEDDKTWRMKMTMESNPGCLLLPPPPPPPLDTCKVTNQNRKETRKRPRETTVVKNSTSTYLLTYSGPWNGREMQLVASNKKIPEQEYSTYPYNAWEVQIPQFASRSRWYRSDSSWYFQ